MRSSDQAQVWNKFHELTAEEYHDKAVVQSIQGRWPVYVWKIYSRIRHTSEIPLFIPVQYDSLNYKDIFSPVLQQRQADSHEAPQIPVRRTVKSVVNIIITLQIQNIKNYKILQINDLKFNLLDKSGLNLSRVQLNKY